MKDEALAMHGFKVEALPIPMLDDGSRERVTRTTQALVDLTRRVQDARNTFFAGLEAKIGSFKRTETLQAFWRLDARTAENEIRRATSATSNETRLKAGLELLLGRAREISGSVERIAQLEAELQVAIFRAYGLDVEDIRTILHTLPPRDPLVVARQIYSLPEGEGESSSVAGTL